MPPKNKSSITIESKPGSPGVVDRSEEAMPKNQSPIWQQKNYTLPVDRPSSLSKDQPMMHAGNTLVSRDSLKGRGLSGRTGNLACKTQFKNGSKYARES